MNETLTELALEYGWACPTCKGTGRTQPDGFLCLVCHGNRVTPSDADRFMDKVAEQLRLVYRHLPWPMSGALQRKVT